MKNLGRIFKKNVNFVKPLYRKVKSSNRVQHKGKGFVTIDVDSAYKLYGNGIHVKREILSDEGVNSSLVSIKHKNNIAKCNNSLVISVSNKTNGICKEVSSKTVLKNLRFRRDRHVNTNLVNSSSKDYNNMIGIVESSIFHEDVEEHSRTSNNAIIVHRVPDTWLRVYPEGKGPHESVCSVIFRCVVCQIGLASFLVLWTMLWIFVIHSVEGPYETKVSLDFEDQQNQLIIDLATELRQITPISPKWREAIEHRIEDERRLTILAVAKGARLHPGHFWDVPGTFLFTVYVMTALGFGAPVPQTLSGRMSALVYAAFSVPLHIYFMVNASTCVVIHVENLFHRAKVSFKNKVPFVAGKATLQNNRESLNCSGNSEPMKLSNNIRKHILRFLRVVFGGRGVPLAMALYYASGAVAFGVCRGKLPLEVFMFPLEFTTTGGLEHVESHVRILYGLYVEGAMWLVSCALATLRRHSGAARASVSRKYRLFVAEPCAECARDTDSRPQTQT